MISDGIYSQLSQAEYRRGSGISKSFLDLVRRSPAHAKAYLDRTEPTEPTKAQVLGTAFHTMVLEPRKFGLEYVVSQKFDRRTKEGKEAAQRFELENVGRTVIDEDDWEQLLAMRDALFRQGSSQRLLSLENPKVEHSLYWTDPATGQQLRARPDVWMPDAALIVDLKTTDDASPEEFARSVATYRYHVQAAYYCDIAEQLTRQQQDFVFLVVEKKAPYNVCVYTLAPQDIELGRAEYMQDLATLRACEKHGVWPGYTGVVTPESVVDSVVTPICLPAWYRRSRGFAEASA